jgi:hypothetical protein
MEIKEHPISSSTKYKINLPRYEEMRQNVMVGDPLYLAETPWEMIQAIKLNRKFEFGDDEIYHMKVPQTAVSQPELRGWGMPLFMCEFETAVLVHLLDKYTEAIVTDYLVPFRVISPKQTGGTSQSNPLLNLDMSGFMGTVRGMIDEHRMNPTTYHTAPVPLEYQVLGGEASQLAPVDILRFYEGRLLQSMGIPGDFYDNKGGAGTGPVLAFKMFEREWQFFADGLNKWFTWVLKKQGEQRSWEKVKGKIIPVSVHEDPDLRQIKLEMAAGGKISESTAFRALDLDWDYEQERIIQEQAIQNKRMEEAQKEQEETGANRMALAVPPPGAQMMAAEEQAAMAGQGGAPPPGGALPPPPGGGMPMPQQTGGMGATMDDLMAQSDQMAQQIIGLDPTSRRSALVNLKNQNPTLHAMVKQKVTDMEQQGAQMGVQMMRQGQL